MDSQRTRLTKQLLRNALLKLLAEKNLHKISVRELCECADINRTTFYRYYGCPEDVLYEIRQLFIDEIKVYLEDSTVSSKKQLSYILEMLNRHSKECKLLMDNPIKTEFEDELLQQGFIRSTLDKTISVSNISEAEAEYLKSFLIAGTRNVIRNWIHKDYRERPEELAEYIHRFIRGSISALNI